ALMALICLCATGCVSFTGPERPFSAKAVTDKLTAAESEIDTFLSATDAAGRNAFMRKMLALIDIRFSEFVGQLDAQKKDADAGTALATAGLSIAGTLVGSENAKTNLAAATAFLTGGKETIDKTYFYEKSVPALVAAMNAARNEVRLQI